MLLFLIGASIGVILGFFFSVIMSANGQYDKEQEAYELGCKIGYELAIKENKENKDA